MANRAYLFCVENNTIDNWRCPYGLYYDSRWTIPVAWFFFFKVADVKTIDILDEKGQPEYQEIRLIADKQQAIDLFSLRLEFLLSITNQYIPAIHVQALLDNIDNWSGDYLVVDPREIFDCMPNDDSWHIDQFTRILSLIDADDNSAQQTEFYEKLQQYAVFSKEYPEKAIVNMIGYTYG